MAPRCPASIQAQSSEQSPAATASARPESCSAEQHPEYSRAEKNSVAETPEPLPDQSPQSPDRESARESPAPSPTSRRESSPYSAEPKYGEGPSSSKAAARNPQATAARHP